MNDIYYTITDPDDVEHIVSAADFARVVDELSQKFPDAELEIEARFATAEQKAGAA